MATITIAKVHLNGNAASIVLSDGSGIVVDDVVAFISQNGDLPVEYIIASALKQWQQKNDGSSVKTLEGVSYDTAVSEKRAAGK